MPESVLVGQQAYELLRGVSVAYGNGTALAANVRCVSEFARLTGVFAIAAGGAPAAGFPRLVQSVDGSSDDIVTVFTQDTTQLPLVVYTLDTALLLPYVKIQYTNSAAVTTISYLVQGWPSGASGSSSSGSGGTGTVQSGTVVEYVSATAPSGYLLCDGTVYAIATYPTLGALCGSTYGGNGTTTFGVPDLRGRVPVGMGTGSGLTPRTIGATGGEEGTVLVTANLAAHLHGVTDPGHVHTIREQVAAGGATTALLPTAVGSAASVVTSLAGLVESAVTGITTTNTGSGTAHNTMQPFQVLNYIVKT